MASKEAALAGNNLYRWVIAGLGICFAAAAGVYAQTYPDTMWVQVTFYDYKAERRNFIYPGQARWI